MNKIYLLVLMTIFAIATQAVEPATISATVDGYSGRAINFEFIDNPDNNNSYTYREGNLMEFDVELDEPSLLKINAWVWLIVSPGDQIHLDIHYEGTSYKTAEIRGTEKAVLLNETIRDMRSSRLTKGYKMNPMAALVTLVPSDEYYQMTLVQWAEEKAMLEAIKADVDPFAYHYIYSELEGTFMSNLVKYPYMASDVLKKPLEESFPKGYWEVLNDYQLRDDVASLKSFTYLGWLLEYMRYVEAREAHKQNKPFNYFSADLQKDYNSIISFYEDTLLDSALYVYLYSVISQQHNDFEVVEQLTKDYIEKYNKNSTYKESLLNMLQ